MRKQMFEKKEEKLRAGYGDDMSEDFVNELLDDMDFHFNKVKCRKIEQLLPRVIRWSQKK